MWIIDVKGREFWANCSRNILPEEYFFREESSAVTLFRAKNSWRNIFRNKISRISQEYYSQQGIVFPRIPRNIIPELFFPELKFLWGSGSKSSRNFFPDHLTPLRKINSLGIYVPGAPRNVNSCWFLAQEYIFLPLLGIYIPREIIFLETLYSWIFTSFSILRFKIAKILSTTPKGFSPQ